MQAIKAKTIPFFPVLLTMVFSSIIGHNDIKRHLIEEVRSGKVSHAKLFLGKSGYGGLPLALAFSQYLFCEKKQSNDSCGQCNSCRKVERLQHPDLHFSFPTVQTDTKVSDGNLSDWREQLFENPYFDIEKWTRRIDKKERKPIIGTHESVEIVKKLSLRSYEGGYKVMIIWMVENMNTVCANKLLKILEEPPAKTVFVLLSESQDRILQTILSRTQILNIPRIPMDEISNYLKRKEEKGSNSADSIASRADGDLIAARELSTNLIELDENRDQFIQLMRVCYKKNVPEMIEWAEKAANSTRMQQMDFLSYALHMFRQSLLKNYTEDQLTRVSEEEELFLGNFARFITGNNIFDFQTTFSDAHYHIERNANPKILFMNLCFKVMRFIHAA